MTNVCIEDLVLEIGVYENMKDMRYIYYKRWISKHYILSIACEYNHSNQNQYEGST